MPDSDNPTRIAHRIVSEVLLSAAQDQSNPVKAAMAREEIIDRTRRALKSLAKAWEVVLQGAKQSRVAFENLAATLLKEEPND